MERHQNEPALFQITSVGNVNPAIKRTRPGAIFHESMQQGVSLGPILYTTPTGKETFCNFPEAGNLNQFGPGHFVDVRMSHTFERGGFAQHQQNPVNPMFGEHRKAIITASVPMGLDGCALDVACDKWQVYGLSMCMPADVEIVSCPHSPQACDECCKQYRTKIKYMCHPVHLGCIEPDCCGGYKPLIIEPAYYTKLYIRLCEHCSTDPYVICFGIQNLDCCPIDTPATGQY